jgi:hypothetical protein
MNFIDSNILTIVTVLPLAGAMLLMFFPRREREMGTRLTRLPVACSGSRKICCRASPESKIEIPINRSISLSSDLQGVQCFQTAIS